MAAVEGQKVESYPSAGEEMCIAVYCPQYFKNYNFKFNHQIYDRVTIAKW